MSLPAPSGDTRAHSCAEVAPLIVFYVCDELTPEERAAVDSHTALCSACAGQLKDEFTVQEILSAVPQNADRLDSADALLSQCRSELAEALDDFESPRALGVRQPLGWFRRAMALRPAWCAVLLIVAGVGLGMYGTGWYHGGELGGTGNAVNVLATPPLSDQDLANMAVAGISFSPAANSGQRDAVQVHLRAERPMDISGSMDDKDVRRVLTYVIMNGQRFDPGVRLDSLDALRTRASDGEVRKVLMSVARDDQNPACRLKALEALRDTPDDDDFRDLLVEVLQGDPNPGVRVEAVNSLVRSLEERAPVAPAPPSDSSEERALRALEVPMRKDSNKYVRQQCAAALHQLGPPELH